MLELMIGKHFKEWEELYKKLTIYLDEKYKDIPDDEIFDMEAYKKDEEIFTKLWEYLNDEKTSKTRNDIAEFVLEFDDEFQNRVSNNINNNKE